MLQNTFLAIVLLLLVSVNGVSQIPRNADLSVRERAQRIEPFIIASAARYGIDPQLLRVLCFIESRYRLDAVSPKGARGPMQFMPDTAIRYGLRNPHDPQQAVDAAAKYLRDLLRRFGGRIDLALAAYNAGEGTVESFRTGRPLVLQTGKVINSRGRVTGGIPPYRETQEYVRSIIALLSLQNLKRDSANKATRPSRNPIEREDSFIEIQ
jgi:soluble lytic murein transglycosylase-like protein